MLVSQVDLGSGKIGVVMREDAEARLVQGATSLYALAYEAIEKSVSLTQVIEAHGLGDVVDLQDVYAKGHFLPPLTHEDPSHMLLTGTGLTHLGSASTRNAMHADVADEDLSDSMKMFQMGIKGGKPAAGETGVQPEWFYKGNGHTAVAAGGALVSPSFALDGGEEPEIAGLYVIGPFGKPFRVGFALTNEFSDHVTERQNYLFLAHSKLRPASIGPELLIGDLPDHVEGTSRIVRDGETLWEKPFVSGEANMSHTIANLEYHHFKYDLFRIPGDVHVHMFGTATLSVADGISTKANDVFEIEASAFGLPLRNTLKMASVEDVGVQQL